MFTKSIDDILLLFNSKKVKITEFLEKNFKENIHYIKFKTIKKRENGDMRGGHNKIDYLLTEETFELVKNTYNLKHRYITKIGDTPHINPVVMSIENQTIGFIQNIFKGVIESHRQYTISSYRVDLYFPLYKLVIECDENGHKYRDQIYEKIREDYILFLGNTIIRYNPNDELFDLSIVINEINKFLFNSLTEISKLIIVKF